jgi:hypothetical protein
MVKHHFAICQTLCGIRAQTLNQEGGMVEYQKEVEIAKWLMSRGYSEFDFRDGLWMEDTVLDHSWRDIIELMHDYAAAQSTEVRPDTAQQAKAGIAC